jgi:hypothetical protein
MRKHGNRRPGFRGAGRDTGGSDFPGMVSSPCSDVWGMERRIRGHGLDLWISVPRNADFETRQAIPGRFTEFQLFDIS